VNQIGYLPAFGKVYSSDCIANIFCFHDPAHKNMISFDDKRNVFVVKSFGKECKIFPKDKLYLVYNARNNKRKYEVLYTTVLYTQVTLLIYTLT